SKAAASKKETNDQHKSSLGSPHQSKPRQQLEPAKNDKRYNAPLTRARLSFVSFFNSICFSIALSILLHSWWVLGEGLLGSLIFTGIAAISKKKNELAGDQPIFILSGCLIFPIAWGLAGWLFISSIIHSLSLPQILVITGSVLGAGIGLVAGCVGHLLLGVIIFGEEFSRRTFDRESSEKKIRK
ncbi:MAG: hypothetical protein ACRDHZ_20540, partial [Ktedonobacteraceae bacterium]